MEDDMITLDSRVFNQAIKNAKIFIKGKSPLPILSTVLLKAEDHTLIIQGTDLDTTFTINLDLDDTDGEKWAVALPFKAIPITSTGQITLNLGEHNRLLIASINGDSILQGFDAQDYPFFNQSVITSQKITSCETFRKSITKALSCVAHDDSRFQLNNIRFRGSASRLESTDGHKIATIAVDYIPKDIEALVPWDGLKKALRVLPKTGLLNICYEPKNIIIHNGNIHITIRLSDGEYVDTDKLWGAGFPEVPVWCNRAKLDKGIRCAKIVDNRATFSFIQDGIQLSSSNIDLGSCKVKIPAYIPEYLLNTSIIFDCSLVSDAIKAVDTEDIPLFITTGLSIIGDTGLMPMRK
jgi:DNA polymerase III sliding clamp (beta) subunit (PCNA family)